MSSGPEAGMASINRSPRWSMCGTLVERPVAAITDLDLLISGAACPLQLVSELVLRFIVFTADG